MDDNTWGRFERDYMQSETASEASELFIPVDETKELQDSGGSRKGRSEISLSETDQLAAGHAWPERSVGRRDKDQAMRQKSDVRRGN